MIRINLLPHREAKRAQRRREFNFILVGVLIGSLALWYVGKLYLDERIATQQRRNDLLVAENEVRKRLENFAPPPLPARGYQALYRRTVLQASEGCDFDFLTAVK